MIFSHFLDVILKLEDFAVTVDIAGGILKLLAVIASYGLPESEKNRIGVYS